MSTALTSTDLAGALPLVARGKVRDLYALPDNSSLLFVATDRISAYDAVMKNGIKDKGRLLTALSAFWFDFLSDKCPHHLISTTDFPTEVTPYLNQLRGRSMVVKKHTIFPIEAIVRGYITGSAWTEYSHFGTVHGIELPGGIEESQKFEKPLFTPSTKAEQGQHDENIHPSKVAAIIGRKNAKIIEEKALELYKAASTYAAERGIIIADTKFEFGLNEEGEVVLVDEVLTPDSSRFWLASAYEVGRGQESYDKQFLRDWLTQNGVKGKEGVEMPEDIVRKTREKYVEAYEMLTGKKWEA